MNQYDNQKSVYEISVRSDNIHATEGMYPLLYPKQAVSVCVCVCVDTFSLDMSIIQFQHNYHHIISLENLLEAWKEFVKGKRGRKDVQEFERNLMTNIISLHTDLNTMTYEHLVYEFFKIYDPKERDIHKASVRDRLLHHALYKKLYLFFDRYPKS